MKKQISAKDVLLVAALKRIINSQTLSSQTKELNRPETINLIDDETAPQQEGFINDGSPEGHNPESES